MTPKTIAFLGTGGSLLFILAAHLGGLQFSNYDHLSQYISETYARGTPYGVYLRVLGYIPSGIMLFLFGIQAHKQLGTSSLTKTGFVFFGILYGLATVIVSMFPCDEGCNREWRDPSASQVIHTTAALATYLLVPYCLVSVGIGLRQGRLLFLSYASILCGVVSGCFSFMFLSGPTSPLAGLFQRLTEASILIWVLLVSCWIFAPKKSCRPISAQTPRL